MKTGRGRVKSKLFAKNSVAHSVQERVSSLQLYSREVVELANSKGKEDPQDQEFFHTDICKLIEKWEEIQGGDNDVKRWVGGR